MAVCSTYSEPFCRLMVLVERLMVTGFTVTLQVADTPDPSLAVTVILVVPTFTPFTTPSWVTVAILSSSLAHDNVLSSANSGVIVAANVSEVVRRRVISLGISILLTLIGVTCTIVEAEIPEPSSTVAVRVASPAFRAVTTPVSLSKLTILGLLQFHLRHS